MVNWTAKCSFYVLISTLQSSTIPKVKEPSYVFFVHDTATKTNKFSKSFFSGAIPTQFSLLLLTQNPTDVGGVCEERTCCSIPAHWTDAQAERGKGEGEVRSCRRRSWSQTHPCHIWKCFVCFSSVEVLGKIDTSESLELAVGGQAGSRAACRCQSSVPEEDSEITQTLPVIFSPLPLAQRFHLCYNLLWFFLPRVALTGFWTQVKNHHPRIFMCSVEEYLLLLLFNLP